MSYPCIVYHCPVDYPCSHACPWFEDCMATYTKYREFCENKEYKKTPAANISVKRNAKGALVCSKCNTDAALRLVSQDDGTRKWEIEPYCAQCGARLIADEEETQK